MSSPSSSPAHSSGFGPVLFIGLSLYMLATGKPAPPSPDPGQRMDMADLARIAAPRPADGTPAALPAFSAFSPLESPPGAPASPAQPASERRLAALAPLPARPAPPPLPVAAAPAPPGALAPPPRLPAPERMADRTKPGALPPPIAPPPPLSLDVSRLKRLELQGDFVHLRRAPNARSRIYTKLNSGTEFIEIEQRGNWTRVYLPSPTQALTGWIYSLYLRRAPSVSTGQP